MWIDAQTPFNDLPPLPPSLDRLESTEVLKATTIAGRALGKLDGMTNLLPDPGILVNLIPLLESQASNEIENIVTTNDELFRAAHDALSHESPQAREALKYRTALFTGLDSLQHRPLTANTAKLICSTILGHAVDTRAHPGTFVGSPRSRIPIYTPPEGQDVIERHLTAWERYLHDHGDTDPLVVMALAHYQFEAIHPFTDGNGRTGRILNVLFLIQSGLLKFPILYLSGFIVRHKDKYYRLLRDVTERAEWEAWIIFMLEAITSTATWTVDIIEASARLQAELEKQIRETLSGNVPVAELARVLMSAPFAKIENVIETCKVHRQTASRWLKELSEKGIVYPLKVGRGKRFENFRFLDLLFNTPLPE